MEVIGDLQRREGESWMPTSPIHLVDFSLDRAALCLTYCDHTRLLALLRRQLSTNVL